MPSYYLTLLFLFVHAFPFLYAIDELAFESVLILKNDFPWSIW